MVGMNDMCDFVPKRVQRFRQAMFQVSLPAQDNPVAGWLVVAPECLAGRQHNLRHQKSAFKVGRVQPVKFLAQQVPDSNLFRRQLLFRRQGR